jgi:outer membrane immunogenic protein
MMRVLIALATGLLSAQALAADLPMRAPPPPRAPVAYFPDFNWSGVYIGINGGYSFGTTTTAGSTNGLKTDGIVAGATIGGNFQAGAFVFGAEGDFDWDNIKGTPPAAVCPGCQLLSNWLATVRGRVGVAWDRILFYGTGGAAFQNLKFATPVLSPVTNPIGWTAGGGIEFALSQNWSVKAEYLFVDFDNKLVAGTTFSLKENVVRGGVNFRF